MHSLVLRFFSGPPLMSGFSSLLGATGALRLGWLHRVIWKDVIIPFCS